MVFAWNVTLLAAILAAATLLYAAFGPLDPLQRAATAALSIDAVIIPYVFSRAVEALRRAD